jgi:ribosomal protein S18 acetylase RimI-like enzyme
MFSHSPARLPTPNYDNKPHYFFIEGRDSVGIIERVINPCAIDKKAASSILVESFINEYKKYLLPNEISEDLVSWHKGDKSVQKYYENYFDTELNDFIRGDIHYWIQATLDGKLVGWATFQREKLNKNAVYMNLLVVHPNYQKMGIGNQLVQSLINLSAIPNLASIHILLRKKNKGGRIFYNKLGFASDTKYQREDNFINRNLLEAFTWKKPSPNLRIQAPANPPAAGTNKSTLFTALSPISEEPNIQQDDYCGFERGFLANKRF